MKRFSCPACGCQRFTLVRRTHTDVDFSKEGAIEGHPFLSSAGERFDGFLCYECGTPVPAKQANEMLREVI